MLVTQVDDGILIRVHRTFSIHKNPSFQIKWRLLILWSFKFPLNSGLRCGRIDNSTTKNMASFSCLYYISTNRLYFISLIQKCYWSYRIQKVRMSQEPTDCARFNDLLAWFQSIKRFDRFPEAEARFYNSVKVAIALFSTIAGSYPHTYIQNWLSTNSTMNGTGKG